MMRFCCGILLILVSSVSIAHASLAHNQHELFSIVKSRAMAVDLDSIRNIFRPSSSGYSKKKPDEDMSKFDKVEARIHNGHQRMPLESVDLEGMSFTGFYKTSNAVIANIRTNDGDAHIIRLGDYIGLHSGKVIKINRNEIILIESYPTRRGTIKTMERSIPMNTSTFRTNDILAP